MIRYIHMIMQKIHFSNITRINLIEMNVKYLISFYMYDMHFSVNVGEFQTCKSKAFKTIQFSSVKRMVSSENSISAVSNQLLRR